MALNVTESIAVNTIALYLLGRGRHGHEEIPSPDKVLEALAQLSDSSYKRLMGPFNGDFVRQFSADVLPVHSVDLEPILELGELFDASTQILDAGRQMATLIQEMEDHCPLGKNTHKTCQNIDNALLAWAASVVRMRDAIEAFDLGDDDSDDDDDDQAEDERAPAMCPFFTFIDDPIEDGGPSDG